MPSLDTSQLFNQSKSDAKSYVVDTIAFEAGVPPGTVNDLFDSFSSGDGGRIAIAVDTAIFTVFGGPAAGAAFQSLIQAIMPFYSSPPPCTIPGCASVISGTRDCADDYTLETMLTNNYAQQGVVNLLNGFAGSFDAVLTRAVMDAWDSQVTAPKACEIMLKTSSPSSPAAMQYLFAWVHACIGTIVLPMVAGWNKAHPTASTGAPAPTYRITAPVNYTGLSPISMALSSLGTAGGLPKDATVSIDVNGWSPQGVYGVPPGSTWNDNTPTCPGGAYWNGVACVLPPLPGSLSVSTGNIFKKFNPVRDGASSSPASSTTSIATGAVVVAGALALGTYLYARHKHVPVKTVLKSAWKKTGGKIHVPHHLPKLLGRHSR